ncbi:MAG: hypothetical protein K0R49_798 [Burkholderiales bacterium]|jgi:hypothetical protein|nr:hypothetical protein [Burkholderiales bacterium]MCE3268546.1 hypothetical protein [Burkholderiales bacterium]
MKRLLVLLIGGIFVVAGCSSEQAPVPAITHIDSTELVVVKHKTASGTVKQHHKKKKSVSAMEAAQSGS